MLSALSDILKDWIARSVDMRSEDYRGGHVPHLKTRNPQITASSLLSCLLSHCFRDPMNLSMEALDVAWFG